MFVRNNNKKMTQEDLLTISGFLNTRADLPVNVQEIAEKLKQELTPTVDSVVEEVPAEVVEEVPVVEETPVTE